MQSPTIIGPDRRTRIPELRLQELPARIDKAAAVRRRGGVVAGERTVAGTTGCTG